VQYEEQDDRVLRETRLLSILIVPFLVLGFGILYLLPGHTHELFAWTIKPQITAMMLGAAYVGGVYFFLRAVTTQSWVSVQAGFLPVAVFATLLGLTTILHWDRFNHAHIAFITWTALYFTTPFLVAAVWLRNRSRDPHIVKELDLPRPRAVGMVMVAVGVAVVVCAAFLFLRPDVAIQVWPWPLTPLTARVIASLFALAGVAQICTGLDRRWSASRITLQSQLLSLAAIELATVVSWADFRPASPLRWAFAGGLLALLLAIGGLMVTMDLRRYAVRGGRK
jgi:cytochrome bd-type quinol oxidase subunit 2